MLQRVEQAMPNQLGTTASLEFEGWIHIRLEQARLSNSVVYVKKSWIAAAKEGLFARQDVRKGDVVTCYVGEKLPTKIAIKRNNKSYLMRLGINSKFFYSKALNLLHFALHNVTLVTIHAHMLVLGKDVYVDSLYCPHSLARFINDCRTPSGHNVMFIKSAAEGCAWVIATRDIQKDEEIFVDYGRWYWALLKPTTLSYFRHNKLIRSLVDD